MYAMHHFGTANTGRREALQLVPSPPTHRQAAQPDLFPTLVGGCGFQSARACVDLVLYMPLGSTISSLHLDPLGLSCSPHLKQLLCFDEQLIFQFSLLVYYPFQQAFLQLLEGHQALFLPR